MARELDNREGSMELEELRKRADKLAALKTGPWETPSFQALGLPGIWGGRTMPLTLPPNPRTGNLEASVFLAQQFPSMVKMLIIENLFGERQIVHNFDPELPLIERLNVAVNIRGDVAQQDPALARWLLDFIESDGRLDAPPPLTPLEGPFNF